MAKPMDKLKTALNFVDQSFKVIRRALSRYDQVNKKTKRHARSNITTEEWPEVLSKMKEWLEITQQLINRDMLYPGFDGDCVFGRTYFSGKVPKIRFCATRFQWGKCKKRPFLNLLAWEEE